MNIDKNEQNKVAQEGSDRFKAIMKMSQEANSYVYDGNSDMISVTADYPKAIALVDDCLRQVKEIGKGVGTVSKTGEKAAFKWYEKLMLQKVILELMSRDEPAIPESVKPAAKARAAAEW